MLLSDLDRGWLAGIIEGEGYIGSQRDSRREFGTPSIKVGMTDEDTVRRLQRVTGAGSVRFQERGKPNWKDSWHWHVGAESDIVTILTAILPLLSERRSIAAIAVLDLIHIKQVSRVKV